MSAIAIDVMGGDFGPSVIVPASLDALQRHPDLQLRLVGDRQRIEEVLQECAREKALLQRLDLVHSESCIRDDDRPVTVLRGKRNSSMYRAVDQVRSGQAAACVSAGNTGALLLTGRHLLRMLPGIRKPAIIATIPVPALDRNCYLLDVGATVHSDGEQLFQFGLMGAVVVATLSGRECPRVGLLNIGAEEYKGSREIHDAARLFERSGALEYVGFIEGDRLFSGDADVLVCDGFAGNLTIKSSAGVVHAVEQLIHQVAAADPDRSSMAAPLLDAIRQKINPARFNGASLLGLQGIIVKSHGNAGREAFTWAIDQAIKEVRNNVPVLIADRIASAFKTTSQTNQE